MGNKFENCDTCDYANDRDWFGGVACGDRFNLEDGECSGNGYPDWSLRRDERKCDNCSHQNKYRTEEFHCYRSYEYGCVNWISKPITEEKQMKEYRPTSKCTLKNIASKIHGTGCSEAKAEFFDLLHEFYIGAHCLYNTREQVEGKSPVFEFLTKTEKRRNWLSEHGFIEEEENDKIYADTIIRHGDTELRLVNIDRYKWILCDLNASFGGRNSINRWNGDVTDGTPPFSREDLNIQSKDYKIIRS